MKKLLLSAAAVMAFAFTNAQETATTTGFSQGDLFATGSIGYTSTKTGDLKTNEFTIAPRVGYFVTSNIAVGGQLGYTSSTDTEDTGFGSVDVDTNAFTIGAFGRYYFTPGKNFSFFGHLGLDYVTAKSEVEGVPGETKADGFQIAVAPGINYFVSEHVSLEATFGAFGYSTMKVDGADDATNSFELSADLTSITFGILYKF